MEEASEPNFDPTESFSYSWLVNFPVTSHDTYDDSSSFIEMDPKLTPSKRFFTNTDQNFQQHSKFVFPVSESTLDDDLLHADELFSNGFVLPLFIRQSNIESSGSSIGDQNLGECSKKKINESCSSFRKIKGRALSKGLIFRYLDFFTPLYRKIRGRKLWQRRSGDMAKNRIHSEEAPRRISVEGDWRRSCDSESSIYEAVLHCKKSIGKLS